jgi:CRISPR-associated helicase Cas3
MTFVVKRHQLSIIQHGASSRPMYPHQVEVWNQWDNGASLLVTAKTGTGKTRAAMLPVLKRNEWAVAAYPTNELLRDQVRAVSGFAREERINTIELTPELWENPQLSTLYGSADHVLVPIDGEQLDKWQGVWRCKNRGETLRRLLNPDKPKIIFTNPDILFLILGLRYHAEPLEALRRYSTLILDEFHLYQGVEFAHALFMVALARGIGFFRRLVLLSATPDPEAAAILQRTLAPAVIDSQIGSPYQAIEIKDKQVAGDLYTAVHEVEVTPIQVTGGDPVEVLLSQIVALKPEIEELRAENPNDNYLPAVVIVNSVVSAIRLEDKLVEVGFARESLAVIRGLSNRAIRETRGKLLALGTSAIEVGVDFHCDLLLFEASEAASFLQRFGRVGRHRRGRAIVVVPPNAFSGMISLDEVDRGEFEERIRAWYPSAESRPWFSTTESGMVTCRAISENLIRTVQADSHTPPELLAQLREKIEGVMADHANRLGCSEQNLRARRAFERCAAGSRYYSWLTAYRSLAKFRTSLLSVRVHDFTEHGRRKEWSLGEYDVDLKSLLKRGVGIQWNDKFGMLTIRGIGKYRRVHASDIFSEEDTEDILQTKDRRNLRLYQEGESTPVSDLINRENHIFSVVPKTTVEGEIDWRLPVFEAGDFLVAFDGAALLLKEIYDRCRSASLPGANGQVLG